MDLEAKEVNYKDLKPLILMAKRLKAGLHLTNEVPNTRWFGFYVKKKLVAFSALFIKKNVCRLRSSFIHPNYRGNGFYWIMLKHRMDIAKNEGCKKITGYCNKHSLAVCLRLGFEAGKLNRNNTTYIQKILNDG